MSDDLVKRLRDRDHVGTATTERNFLKSVADRIEELEAKLEKATYKSAALVYSDMAEGDRVACDFTLYLTEPTAMRLDFVSTFCLEVKRTQAPIGVVFYLGTTIVGYENLQALGLRQTVRQGDTITIQPPSQN